MYYGLSEMAKSYSGVLPQQKTLIVENTGNIDAYDLHVEDVQLDPGHCTATYLPIRRLAAHTKHALTTTVRGQHVTEEQRNNFEMIIYGWGSDNPAPPGERDGSGRYWFKLPISVVFRDYGDQWHRAVFNFRSDDWFTFAEISFERRERITPPVER